MYQRAFKIPVNVKEIKTMLMAAWQKTVITREYLAVSGYGEVSQLELNKYQKQVRSITSGAIRDGSFSILERTSTPDFIMFVISNVVGLLVTFP